MIFTQGLYTMDAVNVPDGETWEAAPNARVIITSSDGTPPSFFVGNNATLRNVWVGGTKDQTEAAVVQPKNNAVMDSVTLFGYYGGINCGESKAQIIQNCRFVNCGTQLLYHPIYVNYTAGTPADAVLIQDNVFIGCEGYSIHLYHSPNYCTVLRNFIATNGHGIAIEGNHNTARHNIIWQNGVASCAWLGQDNGTSDLTFRHNLFGYATTSHYLNYPNDSSVGKNAFVGDAYAFGNLPQILARGDVLSVTGYTGAQLNSAVNALKTAFAQSLTQLLADTTIENNFTICRNAAQNWSVT